MQIGVDAARAVDNKRVLVVDGDDITATVLQFMLQDENETHLFDSLAAASTVAAADLLLVGLDLLVAHGDPAALKTAFGGVRLLAVADRDAATTADWTLKSGADGVVWKPLTVEAVRRAVDRQLGRRVELRVSVAVL